MHHSPAQVLVSSSSSSSSSSGSSSSSSDGNGGFFYWSKGKKLQAAVVLFIEGVMSCCIFATPPLRVAAAVAIFGLALSVLLSGNLGFLPHLTAALCLALLDDRLLGVAAPLAPSRTFLERCALMSGRVVLGTIVGGYFLIYTAGSLNHLCKIWMRPGVSAPAWVLALCKEMSLLCICNGYGLFAVVTTGRLELVLEELHQTTEEKPVWLEVSLPYKPGTQQQDCDVNSPPPWLLSGHFPRLDWRLWFVPLRLKAALKGVVAGKRLLQQQLQQQQQQAPLQASAAAAEGCCQTRGSPLSPEGPMQLYPSFWQPLIQRISAREPAVLQLLGPQGEALKQLPPPMAIRVSLYDYRMTPPEGYPPYAAFFPEGWNHLTPQEILKLEKDLVQWTIGRWWMRRQQHEIDCFVFSENYLPPGDFSQH
ncbi:hypothetical protein, conserved [Eimeria necatrix]|uniref:Lipase maturation factor 2 n=1 Tax=Eimeria necatrix TaxID=51315 RepID=U6MI54_9EIME|nr:hypothetical protein, conserved [Eimeria necatrix]CDJ63696.1 hypothetical protein, conserved [Eimeria necatrix]